MAEVHRLILAQKSTLAEAAQPNVVSGLRPITSGDLHTGLDDMQEAMDWCLGVHGGPTLPPSMRNIRDVYLAITGDVDFYGVFNSDHSLLSAASTTTLPGLARNSLNKVVRQHYDNLATFRWYERIVDVVAHDGSTQDIDLVMVDGLANLPTVAEGAVYTEAITGDSRESMSFGKRGVYVGITLEMFRRSDIAKMQAIPRELVKAAIRTRSAAIAGIFTAASGGGPTMGDDSTALFHADHGNLATVAFSASEWAAARKRIFGQTVPGTGSKLGLWPTFALLPIDLYDTALEVFGYGAATSASPIPAARPRPSIPTANRVSATRGRSPSWCRTGPMPPTGRRSSILACTRNPDGLRQRAPGWAAHACRKSTKSAAKPRASCSPTTPSPSKSATGGPTASPPASASPKTTSPEPRFDGIGLRLGISMI